MARNNILLRKLAIPKKVELLDGREFLAKCQRIVRDALPENVRFRRIYLIEGKKKPGIKLTGLNC